MEYFLKIPRIGEVSHELTIIKYHKKIGEFARKDEPLVTLETSKAALDVESEVSGTIKRYNFAEGDVVPIGADLLVIEIPAAENAHTEESPKVDQKQYRAIEIVEELKPWLRYVRNKIMSPREKAYCLANKVVPLDAYREFKNFCDQKILVEKNRANEYYTDVALSASQTSLGHILHESAKQVVQANVQLLCNNTPVEQYRQSLRRLGNVEIIPTRLELITWAVIGAMRKFSAFRSRLINSTTIRQFKNPNIGMAVSLDDDGLTTAVIPQVFKASFDDFIKRFRASLSDAKKDGYIATYHSLVISDLSSFGMINAVPVVAYPASATLFIGKPYLKDGSAHFYHLSLSFDHRYINGAGAAAFLNSISRTLSSIDSATKTSATF